MFSCFFVNKYFQLSKKYISNSGNSELARQKVDSFVKNTEEVNKLRYNQDFICGQFKGTTAFGETSKLVWAYLNTTTHKRNFISVGTSYELMLGFADGSLQAAEMKSEAIAREHLANLEKMCPQAIFGFSNRYVLGTLAVASIHNSALSCYVIHFRTFVK